MLGHKLSAVIFAALIIGSASGAVAAEHERPLPENLLLHLDARTRNAILPTSGRRGGQRRIDELFRRVQGRLVSRPCTKLLGF